MTGPIPTAVQMPVRTPSPLRADVASRSAEGSSFGDHLMKADSPPRDEPSTAVSFESPTSTEAAAADTDANDEAVTEIDGQNFISTSEGSMEFALDDGFADLVSEDQEVLVSSDDTEIPVPDLASMDVSKPVDQAASPTVVISTPVAEPAPAATPPASPSMPLPKANTSGVPVEEPASLTTAPPPVTSEAPAAATPPKPEGPPPAAAPPSPATPADAARPAPTPIPSGIAMVTDPPRVSVPTSPAAPPSPPATPDLPDDLQPQVARVSRALQAAFNQNGGSVTLRLDPPELGTVRVELQLRPQGMFVRLHTERPVVHDLLRHHVGQLRHALEQQGVPLERFEVVSRSESAGRGQAEESPTDGRSRGQTGGGRDQPHRREREPDAWLRDLRRQMADASPPVPFVR